MEEVAAICTKCGNGTTGKIYKPYLCANCKIEELEEDVEFYKEQYRNAEKERSEWIRKYNDESIQKTKYRNAFECLYEKAISKNS
jgi:hypothetical protein